MTDLNVAPQTAADEPRPRGSGIVALTLLTEQDTATQLDISEHCLWRWRARQYGPPYTKIGRKIYYRVDAINDWLKRQEVDPSTPKSRREQRRQRT